RRPELADLSLAVQAVPGFDFDGGNTFREQGVQPRQALGNQVVLARRPGRTDGGPDAAAAAGDLLVGRPGEPHLELVCAVAGMNEVRVAVDQPGADPAAVEFDVVLRVQSGR